MNKGDTEIVLGKLREAGHQIVESIDKSDIVIVNTCAVKRTTLNKVIYRLKELHQKTDKKIIVAGCLPLIDLNKIESIGTFSGIISCKTIDSIEEVVEKISNGEDDIKKIEGFSERYPRPRFRSDRISVPIPIAEGCTSNCSYCCVKFARGELTSFKPKEIVSSIEEELREGRKQIYVTTQDTAAYGLDIESNLAQLLKKITLIQENFRIRVGMMNPKHATKITNELIEAFSDKKIYKFLHLPIQSGSDKVLDDMKRGYKVEHFKDIVEKFREKFPNLYLATDIIVGFPTETKEEFQKSCDLIREIKPDKVNLTRFTPMPRTKAKRMKQIESEEKKRRSKIMSKITKEIGYEINQKYVGEVDKGLVIEKGKKGGYTARIQNYKPVIVKNAEPGKFVSVEITEARPTYLKGEILEVKN